MNTKKQNKTRGFTLIELLVVIAIIGILSSVVLASLNSARAKGIDASVKENLNNMRSQAYLYYDSNGNSYGTLASTTNAGCLSASVSVFSDPTIAHALKSVSDQIGGTNIACGATPNLYAVAAQLKTDSTKGFCVSSTGITKVITWNTTVIHNVDAGVCN